MFQGWKEGLCGCRVVSTGEKRADSEGLGCRSRGAFRPWREVWLCPGWDRRPLGGFGRGVA